MLLANSTVNVPVTVAHLKSENLDIKAGKINSIKASDLVNKTSSVIISDDDDDTSNIIPQVS